MQIGENPLKVRNIVSAQLDSFRLLYGGLIKSFWRSVALGLDENSEGIRMIKQDVSKERRALTASNLPVGVKAKLLAKYEAKMRLSTATDSTAGAVEEIDQMALWQNIVEDAHFKQVLVQSK